VGLAALDPSYDYFPHTLHGCRMARWSIDLA